MKRSMLAGWLVLLGLLGPSAGCGNAPALQDASPPSADAAQAAATSQPEFKKVLGPAVAGIFYPRSEKDLAKTVDELLAKVKAEPIKGLRALVCPHAGYEFSGPVAAVAYKQLEGRSFRTVIVLAPSHRAMFQGAALPDADAYETPLGKIPVSPKTGELAKHKPLTVNPPAEVQRPDWWRASPQRLPAFGQDTPHTWEHAIDVQLPFLQRTLKTFQLVPIVFGDVDAKSVAGELSKVLDERTLIVASSDLSHYHPYEEAQALDTRTVQAICDLKGEDVGPLQACGAGPVKAVIELARQKGWKAKLLDCRNSGDTSKQKTQGVVGYAAIAFYKPDGAVEAEKTSDRESPAAQAEFTPGEQIYLLALARKSLTAVVTGAERPSPEAAGVSEKLKQRRACFVTLTAKGQLRGCIGSILPQEPLYQAVIHKAQSAATEDPRFPRVRKTELQDIEVEVSVLTLPRQLEFRSAEELLDKLRPGVDGVVLRLGRYQSTFLPQVWEQMPNKKDFMGHLAEKAGMGESDWRRSGAQIMVYQVEAFKEK